ncbi:hypothetical protein K439DRAFT_1329278, partial [Ramaria rubella]
FTGCLAHIDITYRVLNFSVWRITGIRQHDETCLQQNMKRIPLIPLHEHVWEVVLQQLSEGAIITAIQYCNQELFQGELYNGQKSINQQTTNVHYEFLPLDSTRLFLKFSKLCGIDVSKPLQHNIDEWLNPTSPTYKPQVAAAVFYYKARIELNNHLCICIHTPEMQEAAWKYTHQKQIILDGTFGVCDRWVLLFILLGVDEAGRGVALAFLLFSAPSRNKAMQAGYDTSILYELLKAGWDSLGCRNGMPFKPFIAITNTDPKERGALIILWSDILLILCKFHIRQFWTNHWKKVLCFGPTVNFPKQQVQNRLRALESCLLLSVEHTAAQGLIAQETEFLISLKQQLGMTAVANAGLSFLKHLTDTWMPVSLWGSWSQKGRLEAFWCLKIPVERVIPTTNHLEAFNGILKRKHIGQWQRTGKCLRLDMLIHLLVMHILPGIFSTCRLRDNYYSWVSGCFRAQAGGRDLVATRHALASPSPVIVPVIVPVAWWMAENEEAHHDEATYIATHSQIADVVWMDSYTLGVTCASSLANIHTQDHEWYQLRLSVYGWVCCSCVRM